MKPRYIELKNFLSHHDEKIALEREGFFYLEGTSGIGKSSFIVDALGYALFGPRATRVSQDDLRNWHYPDEPMSVRVDLEFEDGDLLVVERGFDTKGNVFATAFDGEGTELASGPAPVERLIRSRLGGMNWRQFYAAFVARQKEITQLTDATGSQRRALVHEMLGVRELELAQKEASDRRKRTGVELETLIKAVGERNRESVQLALGERERAVDDAKSALAEMNERLERGRTMRAEVEEQLRPLQTAKQAAEQVQILTASLASQRAKLDSLREALARHEKAEQLLAEAIQVEEALAGTQQQLQEAQGVLEGLRARAERTKQHAALVEERAAVAERLAEAKMAAQVPVREALPGGASITMAAQAADEGVSSPSSERLQARLEQIASERKRIRAEREKRSKDMEMLEGSGKCFTCERPLDEHAEREHVFQGLAEILSQLDSEERELDSEETEIQRRLPEIVESEIARGSAERALAKAEEAVERVEGDIRRIEAEGPVEELEALRVEGKSVAERERELKAEEQSRQKQLGELQAAKRDLNPQLHEQIAALSKESEEAEGKLAAATVAAEGHDPERLAEIETQLQRVRAGIAKLEGEQPLRERALNEAEGAFELAKKELESFGQLLAEREAKEKLYGRLTELVDLLDRFARKLAGEIRPALEEIGSEILTQISDGAHIALRIDDDYEITVQTESGHWARAAQLSGGEQVRANIALRMALTRLVSKRTGVPVQFLVMDEPLSSQDQGHVENILALLEELRQHYPQIFIISHVGDVHTAESVNYRLRFDKGKGANRIALEYA